MAHRFRLRPTHPLHGGAPLKSRKVLVLGGTRGIGLAIADAFTAHGDTVMIAARRTTKTGIKRAFVPCDVQKPSSIQAAVKKSVQQLGGLDVIVYSAGQSGWRSLENADEQFWDTMVDTNLKGAFFASQAGAANMKGGGSIIHVSSLAGKRGSARNAVYCASKFGLNGVVQSLAKELGSRGIRVNAVCPVYVDTPGLQEALEHPDAPSHGKNVKEYLREFTANQSALGRMPTAAEVADVCVFLASPSASAITGQCLNVDCGVLPQ